MSAVFILFRLFFVIDFRFNHIGGADIHVICLALQNLKNLEVLDLRYG